MKAVGVVFTARNRGNCLNCVEYVLERVLSQALKVAKP